MLRRLCVIISVAAAISSPVSAAGDQATVFHWAASAGYNAAPGAKLAFNTVSFGEGYGFEGRYGWRDRNFLFEAIGNVEWAPAEGFFFGPVDGSATSFSLMAGATYEAPTGALRPYVGAALGFATMVMDVNSGGTTLIDGTATALAARAFVGASAKISSDAALFVEGRYRYLGPFEVENDDDLEVDGWGAAIGVRISI